jgi:hypothetical protein
MSEPASLIAGYSTTWTRYLPSYPTGEYTLAYVFRKIDGTGAALIFEAVADGVASHKLTLLPASTATLEPGEYQLAGYVTDDATAGTTTKSTVYDGRITVKPNPASATPGDMRSFAAKMVDQLRDAYSKLSKGTVSSVSIQGKNWTQRSLGEMRGELFRWQELLDAERNQAIAGEKPRNARNILVRFNTPL